LTVSVALRGNLQDFGIGEVFQLIGQQRKTGVLEVSGEGERIQLRFDHGSVVSAAPVGSHDHAGLGEMLVRCGLLTPERLDELERERTTTLLPLPKLLVSKQILGMPEIEQIEDLLTQETIFALLRRESGSFHFTAQPVSHEREPQGLLGAEQILMEGLRMVDEWRSFAGALPSESTVFRRVGSFDKFRAGAKHESSARLAAAERVFLLIDGRLSVRRVIDLSRLGTFEATHWIAQFSRSGLIVPVAQEEIERTRRQFRLAAPEPTRLGSQLALGLPFVAALVLLALAAWGPRPEPRAPLLRAPLAEATESFQLLRVRNALEAYHRAQVLVQEAQGVAGEAREAWPDSLDVLVREGFLEPDALTPMRAHPYYYTHRANGAELLGPEHGFASRGDSHGGDRGAHLDEKDRP
jgi:hypothetical protein